MQGEELHAIKNEHFGTICACPAVGELQVTAAAEEAKLQQKMQSQRIQQINNSKCQHYFYETDTGLK